MRIDAPTSFANCLLIPALPDFHQQYPDVTLAIGIDDRPVNIVGEGVDCAIRAGELRDLGLVARRIAEFGYVTCASPAYLNRKGIPGSPAGLAQGHALIGHFSAATGCSRCCSNATANAMKPATARSPSTTAMG